MYRWTLPPGCLWLNNPNTTFRTSEGLDTTSWSVSGSCSGELAPKLNLYSPGDCMNGAIESQKG